MVGNDILLPPGLVIGPRQGPLTSVNIGRLVESQLALVQGIRQQTRKSARATQ